MKKLQLFANLLFITLLLIILLNFALGWIWEIRTKVKFKNFKPYDDIVLKALNLNEKEGLTLYLETFIDRKYDYDQFTEHAENNGYENKYVNVTPVLGRKTISPKDCNKNILFYGGSTTFGYNVTDFQTIPSYLGEMLIENNQKICIKNFGRGSYFSTQETILFQKHILNKTIKKNDIIIFLNGVNENGNRNSRNTRFLYNSNEVLNQKYWDMYKYTFPIFFNSLAINQFVKRVQTKLNIQKKNTLDQTNIFEQKDDLEHVYQKNIDIRNGICQTIKVNCFNLLQPFASIHGKYFENSVGGAAQNQVRIYQQAWNLEVGQSGSLLNKYNSLKDTLGIIDISSSLKNSVKLSYVDGVHYSPDANKKIAIRIYNIIFNEIN
ncbi:hypothetical protein N9500_02850 [Candidatus Pelagibacter sp.]|nr:hypothetical protein [Candidatus Pelagibacter sp.]